MKIVEQTPTTLKVVTGWSDRKILLTKFLILLEGGFLLMLLSLSLSFALKPTKTLFCQKTVTNPKLKSEIDCKFKETSWLGLKKEKDIFINRVQKAEFNNKFNDRIIFLSNSSTGSLLSQNLKIERSPELTAFKINYFILNSTETQLNLSLETEYKNYHALILFNSFLLWILPIFISFQLIVLDFKLDGAGVLSIICIFDKEQGKLTLKNRGWLSDKIIEREITEIVNLQVRSLAIEGLKKTWSYKISLVTSKDESLLIDNFCPVFVEAGDSQDIRIDNIFKRLRDMVVLTSEAEFESSMMSKVQEQEEAIESIRRFLNIGRKASLEEITTNGLLPEGGIKILEQSSNKLVLKENNQFEALKKGETKKIIVIILSLGSMFAISVLLYLLPKITILTCQRIEEKEGYCEIKKTKNLAEITLSEVTVAVIPLDRLQETKLEKDNFLETEGYVIRLIKNSYSITAYKSLYSSYEQMPEINKRINLFIKNSQERSITIKISEGNPLMLPHVRGMVFGVGTGVILSIYINKDIKNRRRKENYSCVFDKDEGKVTIKEVDSSKPEIIEYSLEEITDIQVQESVGYEVILLLENGDRLPIKPSYRYLLRENANIAADFIRSFLNLKSKR